MSPSLVVRIVAPLALAAAVALPGSAPASSSGCVNLPVTPSVKPDLKAAYLTLHGPKLRSKGPLPGSTFYGRCGGTHWAAADFPFPGNDLDDQPETFREFPGAHWRDRGDDGAFCTIPAQLRALWGRSGGPCS
jgi:hypothetical protein